MNDKWIEQLDNSLIVAPSSDHPFFLMIKNKYPSLNFKLISKEEIIDNYYGKASKDHFYSWYVNHQDLSLEIAKIYYQHASLPLCDIEDDKVQQLLIIRDELIREGYLKHNEYFSEFLKKHKIFILNYSEFDPELTNIFQKENIQFQILKIPYVKETMCITKYEDINQEISDVYSKILSLVEQGVSLNKIYLYCLGDEYYYPLIRLAQDFNIPYFIDDIGNYYTLYITKDIIEYYKVNGEVDSYECHSDETKEIVFDIQTLKEKYGKLLSLDNFILLLKDHFLNKPLTLQHYQLELKKTKRQLFLDDEYVFVIGFEQGKYPLIKKDNDYLLDDSKRLMRLSTSKDENQLNKQRIIDMLFRNKNIFVSYKVKARGEEYSPSLLISKLNLEVKNYQSMPYTYSLSYTKKQYAKILDFYAKYRIFLKEGRVYSSLGDIGYCSYHSAFKGTKVITKDRLFSHSFTSLNEYAHCPYRYYLKRILKIEPFEDTLSSRIGSFMHRILELELTMSFDDALKQTMGEFELSNKEKLLFEKLTLVTKQAYEFNSRHFSSMNNPKIIGEYELELSINEYAKLTGKVDKIITVGKNDEHIVIVDYKSGEYKFDLDELPFGLSMQLPIYGLLLKNNKNYQDKNILGLFIQSLAKSETEYLKNDFRLTGIISDNRSDIELFDPTYRKSQYIKSLSVTDKGNFRYATNIFSKEMLMQYLDTTYQVILDMDQAIRNNIFAIAPIVVDGKNEGCKYCPFKDICFKDVGLKGIDFERKITIKEEQ